MMTWQQHLLGKLAEEAAEIAQIALKAQQFGLDDVWEKVAPLTVRDRLCGELDDLLAVAAMLNQDAGLQFVSDPARKMAKAEKVRRYAALSVSLGQLGSVGSLTQPPVAPDPPLADPDGPQPAVSWVCPTPGCGESHTHAEHLVALVARKDLRCTNCDSALLRDFILVPF